MADSTKTGESGAANELRRATNQPTIELEDQPGGDSSDRPAAGSTSADNESGNNAPDAPATPPSLVNDVADLPKSNAAQGGAQDQTKVYGSPETKDYSPAGNPPDSPRVIATNDRDMVKTGPESIGAGGIGNPQPNKDVGTADGSDDTPRGDPNAPQGTGPGINSRTLSGREANNVQGKVRTSHADGEPRE